VKLVHLVGFIIKKFVTMHGHVNIKFTVGEIAEIETNLHTRMISLLRQPPNGHAKC